MRVLLDENLDWRLVRYFDADFQAATVSQRQENRILTLLS